jgi:hypothetical protein
MKSIELKQGDKEFLKIVCEQAPEGITIEQVRRSIKVLDKVEAAQETLLLEDADHQYLVSRFSQMKFIKADRGVLDLFDRLSSAKDVEVKV